MKYSPSLFAILLLLGSVAAQRADGTLNPGPAQPISNLTFDGRDFINAFNEAADRARLVMIFSPT